MLFFKRTPIKASALMFSLFIHMVFFGWSFLSFGMQKKKLVKKPLLVKTVHPRALQEKMNVASQSHPATTSFQPKAEKKQVEAVKKPDIIKPVAKPAQKKPSPVKKESIPSEKKPEIKKPPIADKKIVQAKKKEKPVRNKPDPVSEALIQEIEESIAKIEGKSDKLYKGKKLDDPILAPSLQIDRPKELSLTEIGGENAGGYEATLVYCLRSGLQLPEFGEVTIKLTLKQDGSVTKLVVLKSQSDKNKKHLEAHLPALQFPPFSGKETLSQEQTFVLTFCNDI